MDVCHLLGAQRFGLNGVSHCQMSMPSKCSNCKHIGWSVITVQRSEGKKYTNTHNI